MKMKENKNWTEIKENNKLKLKGIFLDEGKEILNEDEDKKNY